mmetsp:Transcript_9335/g.16874  ORF Transcript_9335/g.16874 Transcript_9335/m.16874 type:complete len:103 (-) Transcript_9335:137-445(-)|eukprot:CAMPEP_0201600096 /NCGR_PEP_ID=MMETSP0492-20130828/1307_1 /ASSEMBLY_ACC=CAM_ASM_000837 /TAXON_ID=420259 /ORGANISM="Thalassiosira gravida, Strain GMp14c1" /LENGTH=102 /DNA_ID=CAMNT_0048062805 /DNA_START=135 /DNA_END=443 /DNA_ORIENTATION=+
MTAEEEANQLDSVTDRVQETELDESRANQALGALSGNAADASGGGNNNETMEVKKEDVDVIVAELECTEDEAEAALRAAAGGEAGVEGEKLVAAAVRRMVVS